MRVSWQSPIQSPCSTGVRKPNARKMPPISRWPQLGSRPSCALECLAEGIVPDSAERIDTPLYHGSALILDAKFAARDSSDAQRADPALCRNRFDTGNRRRRQRHNRPRPALAEKRDFRGLPAASSRPPPKALLSKHDSASVTASPPSLMSCAEKRAFAFASFTRQSISRFSAARSIAGGAPATKP